MACGTCVESERDAKEIPLSRSERTPGCFRGNLNEGADDEGLLYDCHAVVPLYEQHVPRCKQRANDYREK